MPNINQLPIITPNSTGDIYFMMVDGRLAKRLNFDEFKGYLVENSIPGPSGPIGPQGEQGPMGPAGPSGGPSGPSGPSGPTGPSGPSGPTGPRGLRGIQGPAGSIGATGPVGPAGMGYSGYSGERGVRGISGCSGASGFSGFSGVSGHSGISGYSGIKGVSGNSGLSGVSGYSGVKGISGYSGFSGYSGAPGVGVPATGTSGYVLTKIGPLANQTDWLPSGSGGVAANAVNAVLTKESFVLSADSTGNVKSFADANGFFKMYDGLDDVTSKSVFTGLSSPGCSATVETTGANIGKYSITALTVDYATLTITATYNRKGTDITITKVIGIVKSKDGAAGTAQMITLTTNGNIFVFDGVNKPLPDQQTITITANLFGTVAGTVSFSAIGYDATGASSSRTSFLNIVGNYCSLSVNSFATNGVYDISSIVINANIISGGITYTASTRIVKLIGGGAPGTSVTLIEIYKWTASASAPTLPNYNFTYTLPGGQIVPAPDPSTGWYVSIPASPGAGYFLWRGSYRLVTTAGTLIYTGNWLDGNGSVSQMGTSGLPGASARYAFARWSGGQPVPDPVTGDSIIVNGDSLPPDSAWSMNTKWALSDPDSKSTLTLWQANGLYDTVTNKTTYGRPMISYLAVNQLSAITAHMGTLDAGIIHGGGINELGAMTNSFGIFLDANTGTLKLGSTTKYFIVDAATNEITSNLGVKNLENEAILGIRSLSDTLEENLDYTGSRTFQLSELNGQYYDITGFKPNQKFKVIIIGTFTGQYLSGGGVCGVTIFVDSNKRPGTMGMALGSVDLYNSWRGTTTATLTFESEADSTGAARIESFMYVDIWVYDNGNPYQDQAFRKVAQSLTMMIIKDYRQQ